MRNQPPVRSSRVHQWILRVAAAFVARPHRAEWLAEWRSELWYVEQECSSTQHNFAIANPRVTAFCLGAFKDAFCSRRLVLHPPGSTRFGLKTPSQCILSMATLAVMSMLIAFLVPQVRNAILPSAFHDPQSIVIISRSSTLEAPPSILGAEFSYWRNHLGRQFFNAAFYAASNQNIQIAQHKQASLQVAQSSDNLFSVLNIPLPSHTKQLAQSEQAAPLVLSQNAWKKYFSNDLQIIGQVVTIANQRAVVVGVIADKSWNLPGQMDAWLLQDAKHVSTMPQRRVGLMIAQAHSAFSIEHPLGTWDTSASNADGGIDNLRITSLTHLVEEHQRTPMLIIFFALIMACLNLPAVTSYSLGDYPHSRHASWSGSSQRWIFFTLKIALILPIVLCGTLLLLHSTAPTALDTNLAPQAFAAFLGFLFAFRWALADQRQRCPKCLQRLSNPARVGQSAQSFLQWSGTELICGRGHGLLHIPQWPTSWFSTQRWRYLDPSWNGLFMVRTSPN